MKPVTRFRNVFAALEPLRRSQDPNLQSEAQVAMNMIWGERPGVEAKYDALLLKLDRTYSGIQDRRDYFKKLVAECKLAHTRTKLNARIKELNSILTDLNWMRARNKDLIDAAKPKNLHTQPHCAAAGYVAGVKIVEEKAFHSRSVTL